MLVLTSKMPVQRDCAAPLQWLQGNDIVILGQVCRLGFVPLSSILSRPYYATKAKFSVCFLCLLCQSFVVSHFTAKEWLVNVASNFESWDWHFWIALDKSFLHGEIQPLKNRAVKIFSPLRLHLDVTDILYKYKYILEDIWINRYLQTLLEYLQQQQEPQ